MELNKKQKILYGLLYTLLYAISLLPLRVLFIFSDMIYPFVHWFYRRDLVRKQLLESFPEKTEDERRQIERKFYHHFCDLFVEVIKQLSFSEKEMSQHMVFEGFDDTPNLFSKEQPILFAYLGHFGNWEWVASLSYKASPLGIKCAQVYHPLANAVFDRFFLDIRSMYGGECIAMRKTVRRLIEVYNEKEPFVCGMISDQQPRWDAIHYFTPFLNHESAVFIGTEELAKKFNSVVCYCSVSKIKRGYYKCRFIPITSNPNELENYKLTDKYIQMLEADIHRCPELWLWTHKRWTRTKERWLKRQKRNNDEQ